MEAFDAYQSIEGPSEGLFKDNGSRFIALAYPVETEAQVREIVSGLRKEYHDARHHCYAYRLGYKRDVFRASDDGEPSGSAGRPILGQIDALGLSDVLVVVVRYFGGILLGASGLANAYKTAARDAIDHAQIIEKTIDARYRLAFAYETMNDVMRILKDYDLKPENQSYNLDCTLEVSVRQSLSVRFYDDVAGLRTVKIDILS